MVERPFRVHVLALRECAPIVPVGLIDLLRKSIELAATMPSPRPRRRVALELIAASEQLHVTCASGLVLRADKTLGKAGACDLAIVPALDPDVIARLEQNRAAVAWLRRAFASGADVASACTGTFVLAEAGVLDGRT